MIFGSEFLSITEVLIFLSALLLTLFWLRNKDGHKLPPGPYNLPVVGYFPFLTSKPYIKLQKLAKKYGAIFSIKLGSQYTVILNDYQSIKEAFAKDSFIGRPDDPLFHLSKENIERKAFNGLPWKEQRKFSLQLLRVLGLGKSMMQEHIREEICELIERMKPEVDTDFSVTKLLVPSMSNNVASMVFGKRRPYHDPKRIQLDKFLTEFNSLFSESVWLLFFPWMKPVLEFLGMSKAEELTQSFKRLDDHVMEEIEEHKKTFDPNNIRDFIDGYIIEMEKRKNDKNTTFVQPVMKDLVRGLFIAGSETVRTTMDWLLLVCADKQDVQRKVQIEIDLVIGRDKFPAKDEHQKRMPYTNAVIMELMRWRTNIPMNLFRYTIEDTELQSYRIPKHTYVWANRWAVMHDPKIWGPDAEEFKPERFLSKDGKEVVKSDYVIPFSIGKRSCPGEQMANLEIFMYFTALLQKFHFRLPSGKQADYDGQLGVSLAPKIQNLRFSLR